MSIKEPAINTATAPRKHPKKVLIAIPPRMLDELDDIAVEEHRTRSDLFREALRRYIQDFEHRQRERVSYELKHNTP